MPVINPFKVGDRVQWAGGNKYPSGKVPAWVKGIYTITRIDKSGVMSVTKPGPECSCGDGSCYKLAKRFSLKEVIKEMAK